MKALAFLFAVALGVTANPGPAHAEDPDEDLTPPVITITTPSGDVGGWYTDTIDVFAKATDPGRIATGVVWLNYQLSGATTGSGSLHRTSGGTLTISNPGLTTIELEAIDGNGNETREQIQVGVDRVRPTVEFFGRINLPDPMFAQGEEERMTFRCADADSGVVSCTGSQASGALLDTSTIGTHTVTVTTRDRVGHETKVTRTYRVVSNEFAVTRGVDVLGSTTVGREVQAQTPVFDPVPTAVAYQWTRNGVAIPNATGTTYTLTPSDARTTLRLQATATRSGWKDRTVVSPAYEVQPAPISISSQPVLSGDARVGGSLQVAHGTVTPTAAAISYQWLRDGVLVPAATGRTYLPAAEDIGKRISVRVAATAPGHAEAVWVTAPSDVVRGKSLKVTGVPTVSGTMQAGSVLTAVPPTVTVPPVERRDELPSATFAYQWLADGTPIAGATQPTYRLTAAEVGRRVTVRTTATRPPQEGFEPVVLVSIPGPAVGQATPVVTAQAKAKKDGKVKLTVSVAVPGLDPSAPVTVKRGSKVVARGTVTSTGRLVLTLKRQPTGKVTWTVLYAGSPGVEARTIRVSAKVR
ncbi:hypothetical protein [Nocardioides sp.]|uniref:hypothetical protein n=1 Tax=Nocardioides sp. TaxID=35761 RepID=UPI001A17F896|nr:hypothetical protein [Nocardioides sp.]MBJ7356079.1 hypothetical protein [Nocardioides sp.]